MPLQHNVAKHARATQADMYESQQQRRSAMSASNVRADQPKNDVLHTGLKKGCPPCHIAHPRWYVHVWGQLDRWSS